MDYKHFISGCVGGIVGTTFSHPIDTIKTKAQSNNMSIIKNIRGIYNFSGMLGFYKGFSPQLLAISLEKAAVFGVYNNIYNKKVVSGTYTNHLFSGYISGITACIFVAPLEAIKIHQQNRVNGYSIIECYRNLLTSGQLYRSIIPTLSREPPGFAIYFSVYHKLLEIGPLDNLFGTFVYGSLAGSTSWLAIYPADVIKTRHQLNNNRYLLTTAKECYERRILYKGFSLSIIRAIPLHGGAFLGYTYIQSKLI